MQLQFLKKLNNFYTNFGVKNYTKNTKVYYFAKGGKGDQWMPNNSTIKSEKYL